MKIFGDVFLRKLLANLGRKLAELLLLTEVGVGWWLT
jgi:hypothetical protein